MLDNLGGVATFRCGGCGRALKVPAQFRTGPGERPTGPGSRPESPVERTRVLPKVPPPTPVNPINAANPAAAAQVPPGSGLPPTARAAAAAAPAPGSAQPPLILRLALWAIALPLGSFIVFSMARWSGVLTKAQLEDTILLSGWGRFVPIARLLPFCALATALLVQLGVFGLERLRARNLGRRPPGRRPPGEGRGPRRPMTPTGPDQRATNGSRSRDRVIS